MKTIAPTRPAAVAAVLLLGVALAGCSSTTATEPARTGDAARTTATAPVTEPAPDFSGRWKQTNSKSKDAYQEAVIEGDTITVSWITDDGDTTSLFWVGSFEAPTSTAAYSWKSKNDTAKTSKALLASPDKTKTFSYSDGEISYPVSLMGTTTKVRLRKD